MSEQKGDCEFLSGSFYCLSVEPLEVETFLVGEAWDANPLGKLVVD